MRKLTLNDKQFEGFLKLLDVALRTGGLESLGLVVDLYNVTQLAETVSEETKSEEKKETP